MLKRVQNEKKGKVVLEFYTEENSVEIEDFKVDGYLRSVLFYILEDKEIEISSFFIAIENSNTSNLDLMLVTRLFNNNSFVDPYCYGEASNELNSGEAVGFSLNDFFDDATISKFSSDIKQENFVYNKYEFEKDTNVYYNGWYFDGVADNSFVEFVFASPNVYTQQHFDILALSV